MDDKVCLDKKSHERLKRKALSSLQKNHFEFVHDITQGRFGTIMAIETPVHRVIAAKVVTVKDTWPGELKMWMKFCHINVVPLLGLLSDQEFNVFLMPLYKTSLEDVLKTNEFRSDPASFRWTKHWIRDVASGLSYLHGLNMCHLNLQPCNIFINVDQIAEIGDFGCLNTAKRPVKNYGVPKQYSPPECWTGASEKSRPRVEGIPYDLWSLGMTAFNVWNDYTLENRLWGFKDWNIDLYPHVFDALTFDIFLSRITRVFPKADISCEDILDSLNFMKGLLRRDPSQRPVTSTVLQHALWSGGGLSSYFVSDPIWKTYQYSTSEENRTSQDNIQDSIEEPINEVSDFEEKEERSERKTGVRCWLRKKWKKFKTFFKC